MIEAHKCRFNLQEKDENASHLLKTKICNFLKVSLQNMSHNKFMEYKQDTTVTDNGKIE